MFASCVNDAVNAREMERMSESVEMGYLGVLTLKLMARKSGHQFIYSLLLRAFDKVYQKS